MPQNKQKRDAIVTGEAEIPGFPGYRTRDGRTGLDPIDTRMEAAYMEGKFYRKLFTGKIRTRNLFHLTGMFIFGPVLFSLFMIFVVTTIVNLFQYPLGYLVGLFVILLPPLAITGALAVNLVINILIIAGVVSIPDEDRKKQTEARKREKKQPKRRKDYK